MYEQPKVEQLIVGLIRHLTIAQTTSNSKEVRLKSLKNISEVLEYVIMIGYTGEQNFGEELLTKFFSQLLVTVKIADVQIHMNPIKFEDEIGFLNTIQKICSHK